MTLQLVKDLRSELFGVDFDEEGVEFDPRSDVERAAEELAGLSPDEYESVRRARAKELKIRVPELDKKVRKARKMQLPEGPEAFLADFEDVESGLVYKDPEDDSRLWLCDPLEIQGLSSDEGGGNHALVLGFRDTSGRKHRLPVNRAELAGEGAGILKILLARGFRYNNGRKETELLKKYLIYAQPTERCLVVSKSGWFLSSGQGWGCFVMPGAVIGNATEQEIVFDSAAPVASWGASGTLENWRDKVSALARGNSRLVFALSMAFAPPLLRLSGSDKGGFHIVGSSSTGKTTALRVANSVWGSPARIQTWRSTGNGMEAQSELHNHSLHCLDELGQADAREAGQMSYMNGSGAGKARAARDGSPRAMRSWETLQLSTGEIGLAEHMEQGRQKIMAGQEVRLVDLQADAGRGMGIFETLHGYPTPNALAIELTGNIERFHGTAIRAYLEALVGKNPEELVTRFRAEREAFLRTHVPTHASGQVSRVASRFFLVAFAGELATELGVTGWSSGEATRAALVLFDEWQRERGGVGNREFRQVLDQVQMFFERYGESRFIECDPELGREDPRTPPHRAGYREFVGGRVIHYVLAQVFTREVLEGLNRKTALKALVDAGILRPDKKGPSRVKHLGNPPSPVRVYVLENVLGPLGGQEDKPDEETDGGDFFG